MLIEVVVNNPLPVVTREDAFEDTMLLIDMVKQHVEKDTRLPDPGYQPYYNASFCNTICGVKKE